MFLRVHPWLNKSPRRILPQIALGLLALSLSRPSSFAAPIPQLPTPKLPDPSRLAPPSLPGGNHRFEDLFAPYRTDLAALSPDGRHLAYTIRNGSTLSIFVVAVDQPGKLLTKLDALNDEDATPMLGDNKERTPAAIHWLRWATPNRLVAETNAQPAIHNGQSWYSLPGVVIAFDADGSHPKTLVTPRDVAITEFAAALPPARQSTISTPDQPAEPPAVTESADDAAAPVPAGDSQVIATLARRPRVIDFLPGDPESIIVRADDPPTRDRAGRSELFKVNVRTGATTSLSEEVNFAGYALLLDRQGHRGVSVPNTTRESFPHAFSYDSSVAKKTARPLDALAGFSGSAGFTVSPENFFGERAVPVGFDEDASILYFASNLGRDTYGYYGLDLKTGKRTGTAFENPAVDLYEPAPGRFVTPSPLVFDRFTRKLTGIRITEKLGTTRWVRPEWQAIQAECERALPGRNVEIQEWDETGQHFLVLAQGPTDAGAFYLFDRTKNQLAEFVRRAPALDGTKTHPTANFAFTGPGGARLNGVLTVPRNARLKPLPVVVLCQSEPWLRVSADYSPVVQALAEMGVCVVQVNTRCAWGAGRQQRAAAMQSGFEEIASADIVAALDWVEAHFEVSKKRVGIIGERRGAYLALRTLQLHPGRFRCAIALEPTLDLAGWLDETRWTNASATPALTRAIYGSPAHLKEAPLFNHPELFKSAMLLLSYPGPPGASMSFVHANAERFAGLVRRTGQTATVSNLDDDYMARLPQAKAAVFREIEAFINDNIYNFRVDVGDVETKKE